MGSYSIAVAREVGAPADSVYGLLADYERGHPSILPKPWFEGLDVEEGGRGAGTRIRVRMKALGRRTELRMKVREPEPGRVLVEEDEENGVVTTFTVDPLQGGSGCRVEFSTTWRSGPGILARLEGVVVRAVARRIYRAELELLARRMEAPPGRGGAPVRTGPAR
jgi:hypothetical protein